MDAASARRILASLTPDKNARMLAMLCHELTILARDTYGEANEVGAVAASRDQRDRASDDGIPYGNP